EKAAEAVLLARPAPDDLGPAREPDGERAPRALPARRLDAPAHHLDEAARDGEAEPAPLVAAAEPVRLLPERVEEVRPERLGEALARVPHADERLGALRIDLHEDAPR